jgi:hypothetical protein
MSIIICTFVLSVLITKTGSVHELGVAEGGLHPTLLNNKAPRSKLGDLEIMLSNSSWTLRTTWVTEQLIPYCGENKF